LSLVTRSWLPLLLPHHRPTFHFFFLLIRRPLRSTLFPYTTLFRSQQLNSIVLALAGAQRIFELEDEPSEVDNGDVIMSPNKEVKNSWYWDVPEKNGDIKKVPIKGHIIFDHVNFSYVPEHQILYDINIDAKPGMKVALVGETGAGKTTISNMLNRFYEIQSGKITYDGVPISQIRKNDLRHSLSIV